MSSPGSTGTRAPRKVAVVTGAARGIGRAVVEWLVSRGFDLAATDLDPSPPGPEAAGDARVLRLAMDVTDAEAIVRASRVIVAELGRVDLLVNNAGVFARTPACDLREDTMTRILDVNLGGTLRCTSVFGALMADYGGGRIVNIASVSGLTGAALASVYAASKGGIIAATRSAARELADRGITVCALAPGYCDTDMLGPERATVDRLVTPRIPKRRVASASEVAEMVGLLATASTDYITGSVVTMDGGITSG